MFQLALLFPSQHLCCRQLSERRFVITFISFVSPVSLNISLCIFCYCKASYIERHKWIHQNAGASISVDTSHLKLNGYFLYFFFHLFLCSCEFGNLDFIKGLPSTDRCLLFELYSPFIFVFFCLFLWWSVGWHLSCLLFFVHVAIEVVFESPVWVNHVCSDCYLWTCWHSWLPTKCYIHVLRHLHPPSNLRLVKQLK